MSVCVLLAYFSKYVSIHVLVFVYTLVSNGWGQGSDGNRKCLFLNVRSVLRHDALPFSKTPAANTLTHARRNARTHTHKQRMVQLPTRSVPVVANLN